MIPQYLYFLLVLRIKKHKKLTLIKYNSKIKKRKKKIKKF